MKYYERITTSHQTSFKMYLQRILFLLIIKTTAIGCTITSTVCFGAPGLSCTTHKLSCSSPLVIKIINTTYGYRPGCNDENGLSDCKTTKTACCNEEPDDCFTLFSSDEHQRVLGNCSGVEACELQKFRRYSNTHTVCNGRIVSAYSKIQYACVTFTNDDAVEDDNTGAVVGGIIGPIIIFAILIAVLVFLYKRKAQRSKETTPAVDGPGTNYSRKDASGYDEIELENNPRVNATTSHLQSNINSRNESSGYEEIELEEKPTTPITVTDNYDHVGDDKLKVNAPKELDNYNHIGTHDHSVHEDNYNHIGNNPSVNSIHLESDYNHVNGVCGKPNDEDDYNHIGNNDNNNVITADDYHHIKSGDIKVEEGYDNDNDNRGQDDDAPYTFATC